MTDNTGVGGAIGTMIGLGIGIVVAKKLTEEFAGGTKTKKSKSKIKQTKSEFDVAKETGVWS